MKLHYNRHGAIISACQNPGEPQNFEVEHNGANFICTITSQLKASEIWEYAHQFKILWREMDLDRYDCEAHYQDELFDFFGTVPHETFVLIFNDVIEYLSA